MTIKSKLDPVLNEIKNLDKVSEENEYSNAVGFDDTIYFKNKKTNR